MKAERFVIEGSQKLQEEYEEGDEWKGLMDTEDAKENNKAKIIYYEYHFHVGSVQRFGAVRLHKQSLICILFIDGEELLFKFEKKLWDSLKILFG